MATTKKGILTKPLEWAKHLRPFGKRKFWHRERRAAQRDVARRREQETAG